MKINNVSNTQKAPSFGSAASLGKKILNNKVLNNFAKNTEYDGFTMSFPVTLSLLYGATVLPRYFQAYDKHDKREILTRDLTSITAILFLAASLRKGFSKLSSKLTGFALNFKPQNHKGVKKYLNYLNPRGGIQVMNKADIIARYSDLEKNGNGFLDFAEFIRSQGGKLNKVLASNENTAATMKEMLGKDVKKASHQEILNAWNTARPEQKEAIYKEFKNPDNSFTKKARIHNNLFNFISTFLVVPSFMIWLESFNEKTTKRLKAQEDRDAAIKEQEDFRKNDEYLNSMKVNNYHTGHANQTFRNLYNLVNKYTNKA